MSNKSNRSYYVCQQCGFKSVSFLGKCPECDSWNSFVEQIEDRQVQAHRQKMNKPAGIVRLADIKKAKFDRIRTNLAEFDRVLGGGIVLGSLILISGDPGIGKSTLLTQIALSLRDSLYIAGEESPQQIKIRTDRIDPKSDLGILSETDVDVVIATIRELKPSSVVIDSIQTLQTEDLTSVPGSVGQVRECAYRLMMLAKQLHIPIFLIGHVTKEGTVAGPKTLEHIVDVVLSLEGDSASLFRILRSTKNRFGPTDEVGVFEMIDAGMIEVKNPSKLFLDQKVEAPGSAVVSILTGLRPILLEVQALVTKSSLPSPRRTGSGVDNNRLQLLVAVLQKRLGLPLYDQDIFVNVTGGMRVFEPAADLGICLSIISSFKDLAILKKTIFIGEVGLLGELRAVRNIEKRASEAKKLGFTNVISSQNSSALSEVVRKLFSNQAS